jgi:hypothetical protein
VKAAHEGVLVWVDRDLGEGKALVLGTGIPQLPDAGDGILLYAVMSTEDPLLMNLLIKWAKQ